MGPLKQPHATRRNIVIMNRPPLDNNPCSGPGPPDPQIPP